jgi:molybdopterin-containing oxidoreductase family membrane subunit
MLEKALKGSKLYWAFIALLAAAALPGMYFYYIQLTQGLAITGMSRDVSWGLYISQFTFFVGVAASAVMVVIPYYLHDFRQFGKITILVEFLAVGAVLMCMLFIFIDMGQPSRIFNMVLHPTPWSLMFWDMIALMGYLALNITIGWTVLGAEHRGVAQPEWVKPLIYLSIPWAISIHTVTAFLYAGIPGRAIWMTAIMAARFLASAFASGPSLLIVLALAVRRFGRFDAGREAVQALAKIAAYALTANLFFLGLEFFTAYYSGIPSHRASLDYLFFGLEGHGMLVPWMWASILLSLGCLPVLILPDARKNETVLAAAAMCVFFAIGIEKGLGVVIGGFVPNAVEAVTEYAPTAAEALIALSVWATGALVVTVLYKVVVGVRNADAVENAINQSD